MGSSCRWSLMSFPTPRYFDHYIESITDDLKFFYLGSFIMLPFNSTIRKNIFAGQGPLYSECLKVIKKIWIKTLYPEKDLTNCAAKTLENSLFMAYGSAVCALEPYVVWNLFFISFRKLNARERSKSWKETNTEFIRK